MGAEIWGEARPRGNPYRSCEGAQRSQEVFLLHGVNMGAPARVLVAELAGGSIFMPGAVQSFSEYIAHVGDVQKRQAFASRDWSRFFVCCEGAGRHSQFP